jgi:hypothetical protein
VYAEIETLVKRFKALTSAERKGMNEHATRQGYPAAIPGTGLERG